MPGAIFSSSCRRLISTAPVFALEPSGSYDLWEDYEGRKVCPITLLEE